MNARDLLREVADRGGTVELRPPDGVVLVGPPGVTTDAGLVEQLRAVKPAIVAILAGNGATPSHAPRWRALAQMLARVDALAPGVWSTLYPRVRADPFAWAAITRAEARVDSAAGASDVDFASALAALEAAWRTGVARHREVCAAS